VWVATITCLSVAILKTAFRGRSWAAGSCYNRLYISNLGNKVASPKMVPNALRHVPGENVKLIVPQSPNALPGKRQNKHAGRDCILRFSR
jgi:hypothetical protein